MNRLSLYLVLLSVPMASLAQQAPSPSGENQILVWRVGSPYVGDTPDTTVPLDLKLRAREIGSRIQIESFPAKGFAREFFDAIEMHQEPDIIAFDNMGIIDGSSTSLGGSTGIGSSATVRKALIKVTGSLKDLTGGSGGWQYLVSTSKNHEAARKLALQPPECDPSLPSSQVPADVQQLSKNISKLYLEQSPSLGAFEDSQRLIAEGVRRDTLSVSETRACGSWGNKRLIFVSLNSTYESEKTIGQIPVLLILRNQNNNWKLLAASTDPISTSTFLQQIPRFSQSLQGPSRQKGELLPASRISPLSGLAPTPVSGQRFGEFSWQPSSSEDVVAEIVEFAYQNDARLFLRPRLKSVAVDQISSGQLWRSKSEWQWRVWSISSAGDVVFSQVGSFGN